MCDLLKGEEKIKAKNTPNQVEIMTFSNRAKTHKTYLMILNNRSWIILLILSLMMVASCTPHRKIVYLQREAELADTIFFTRTDYVIQSGDILHINILTLDEKSYAMFNADRSGQQRTTQAGGGGIGNVQMFLYGYNVNENGYVKVPVVGDVKVAGKTLQEATKHIEAKVEEYLIGATVIVKLVNFSITVIGEVGRPGKYYIYDNRVNILDIIAVAGDLTDFGNRNIVIVRQSTEGATFGSININNASSIASEFFYLQPNDIVYVEPFKLKRLGINQFPFSLVFSTISFALFLITYFGN